MKLAVCLPSRGLIHSRTLECILENLQDYHGEVRWFISNGQPIPDCFNDITQRAKNWGADYFWFVEEDMWFQEDTLRDMLATDMPVCTIDYPVSKDFDVVLVENGATQRFGTGCTLVKRGVFEQVGYTWRSDVEFVLPNWEVRTVKHTTYGQHDIEFAQRLKKAGIPVEVVGYGDQYRMVHYGQQHNNAGAHVIEMIKGDG